MEIHTNKMIVCETILSIVSKLLTSDIMVLGTVDIVLIAVALLVTLYYYSTRTFNYWKLKGVPGPKPIIFFGTIKDIIFFKLSLCSYLTKIYNEYRDEPVVGIYGQKRPILVVKDLELLKAVLIKDFGSFSDRAVGLDEEMEPISAHLFNLEPERWRLMRMKLTPAFTSGKLRDMFHLLKQCGERLEGYLAELDGKSADVRELAARFTIDVIGLCAFGVEANAITDQESIFRKMGKRVFETDLKATLRFQLRMFAPKLAHFLGKWLVDEEVQQFFINLTRDTMEYRDNNGIARHDFLDQLRDLKKAQSGSLELSEALLVSQLFVFFAAGFETSSSTISNCLLELAMNHEIRDRLRKEIRETLETTKGEITYDAIHRMKYLDQCFKETLRKYPPLPTLMRESTAPYKFPGTELTIPAGVQVWIPIFGIHHDPKYFPEPEVFDPDRFTDEAVKSRSAMTFLAFGDGPRNCIGARFGSMQTKLGLFKILQNCTVDVCDKTDIKYEIDQRSFMLIPKNGVHLKIMKSPVTSMS